MNQAAEEVVELAAEARQRGPGRPRTVKKPAPALTTTLEEEHNLALINEARRQNRSISSLARQYILQGLIRDGLVDEDALEIRPLTPEEYALQRIRRTEQSKPVSETQTSP